MPDLNQNPEQQARDEIDTRLRQAGWAVQSKNQINWNAALGVAIREYPTDVGPADYVLFVNRQPVGIIEAKREEEGHRLTVAEDQSQGYATAKLKHVNHQPLPFTYESTGVLTRFTDHRDPKPRSRPVFSFHRPETLHQWLKAEKSLRARLLDLPVLETTGLRDCQIRAIQNLERSFKDNRPRALVQMATGSGKTFTAITAVYRLLKFAKAERVLFLVDTKNLGEQAEQEFMAFNPVDDNRKFTELYNVQRLEELTGGLSVGQMAKALLHAYDPDMIADKARLDNGLPDTAEPPPEALQTAQQALIQVAASAFTGEVIEFLDNVRRVHEQIIDTVNLDRVTFAGWDTQARERALHLIEEFTTFIEQHKDQITALRIYYSQPYQRRNLTFQMMREVLDILKAEKPRLAPLAVWQAYEEVEGKQAGTPISELTALVALIRKVVGLDQELTLYEQTVNRNFQRWVFQKQAGAAPKFNEAQMEWLRMIKDHIITSMHIERDDLNYAPFDAQGGLARMYQLFGEEMDGIIDEMNEALVA